MRRLILLCLAVLVSPAGWAADLSPREERMLGAVNASIRAASVKYAEGQYEECGAGIRRAIEQVDAAMDGATPELYESLEPAIKRIRTAHAMLQLEGLSLPPWRQPKRPDREPGSGTPGAESQADSDAARDPRSPTGSEPMPDSPDGSAVSFTSDVAPILVERCGQCHIDSAKGQFAISSYAALTRGTPAGAVIFPGDVTASRLIATIETGDMPRGGGTVPAEELEILKDWIRSGAEFDGADPQSPLSAAGGDVSEPGPTPEPTPVRRASGEETVSFAADVAPLFVENCQGCHLDAMQIRGGLRLDTFAQMMRGGDSGPLVIPGDAAESLLVKKLQGRVGNRMPAGGRPPLPDESIQLISTWIDEGARLDGAGEDQPLSVMSQLAWAAEATPQQLSERRRGLAEEHLDLVMASAVEAERVTAETEHFHVAGMASQQTIDRVGQLAEASLETVRKNVPGDRGEAYFSGRATIFVMPRRYDYSEFAKMAEQRSVPSDWMSHWKSDGVDAYIAMVASEDDDEQVLRERLLGRLVSLAVATRGVAVPRWFAEGVGATLSAREGMNRDRQTRQQTQSETAEAIAAMKDAKSFLEKRMPPAQSDRIAAAVTASMLDRTRRRAFDRLLRLLRQQTPFENAFAQSFGGSPEQYITLWLNWARGPARG